MNAIEQLIVDENGVAFYPMMGNSYQLNELANEIVALLKQSKSKTQIIDELQEKYDVSYEDLFIDVSDFFSKLKVYGLV